jgi:arsenate reductase
VLRIGLSESRFALFGPLLKPFSLRDGRTTMSERIFHVLFLSRRNSARSILAEAVLNKHGKGRFKGYSAGVAPVSAIDSHVIELMLSSGLTLPTAPPKHYSEYTRPGVPALDFVFTLSDTAAGEPLPEWPGLPVTAHWSSPDPILVTGAEWERKRAFARVLTEYERRLSIFVNLPFASLDRMSLKSKLDEIGQPG